MHALRDCTELSEAGPKAQRLARALRAGIAVPDGVVLLPNEPLPSPEELASALLGLGVTALDPSARLVVRSSALTEDLAGHSAAGLFVSVVGAAPSEVLAEIETVRRSGDSDLVRMALGGSAKVAVLIQRQVPAARLGVLYRSQHGDLRCEEREAAAPEWADVTVSRHAHDEVGPLTLGAAQLALLVSTELGAGEPAAVAIYAEYAVSDSGQVTFLQVRPAPRRSDYQGFALSDDHELTYVLDQEHNPDPMSAAQQGLVAVVADLVPWLRQRPVCGYLFWATTTGHRPPPTMTQTREVFTTTILPTCEAMLSPPERRIVGKDGALREELLVDPSLCELTLSDALTVYRSIYSQYVGLLGPAIRRARTQLDQLLLSNLGEPLGQHGALLSGIGGAQTERVTHLWQLGREGCQKDALRLYLARFGAFSSCWDVVFPCDDEQPQAIIDYARHLAGQPASPTIQHALALAQYHDALQKLLDRLPRMARGALKSLLPLVRDAMLVAEDDDLLFFRAQRLVRWALLAQGAKLYKAGRLSDPALIFDLPWRTLSSAMSPLHHPLTTDLSALALSEQRLRQHAKQLVPPERIAAGHPEWALPDGRTLSGTGIAVGSSVVSGRALVVPRLDNPAESLAQVLAQLQEDTILVLPTLLPSWAPAVWGALAVVTDSGGALSHGAILARERGIPAVLGTRLATQIITTGQTLLLDGARGLVVLSPATKATR